MQKQKIFISSVQNEFSQERNALAAYIRKDPLLCTFFEPFLFEDVPATEHSPVQFMFQKSKSLIFMLVYWGEITVSKIETVFPRLKENMIMQRRISCPDGFL
jgi:ATP-dependent DNA helicase RecG